MEVFISTNGDDVGLSEDVVPLTALKRFSLGAGV